MIDPHRIDPLNNGTRHRERKRERQERKAEGSASRPILLYALEYIALISDLYVRGRSVALSR